MYSNTNGYIKWFNYESHDHIGEIEIHSGIAIDSFIVDGDLIWSGSNTTYITITNYTDPTQ